MTTRVEEIEVKHADEFYRFGSAQDDIAYLLAEVKRLEGERDAAHRAVCDAPHAENCAFWHDWHNEGKCDCWVSEHRAVLEAARKLGGE